MQVQSTDLNDLETENPTKYAGHEHPTSSLFSFSRNTSIADEEKQPELKRIVTADDWNGPLDRENPHNWPLWRRWYQTLVTAFVSFVGSLASSVFTPAIEPVLSSLHTTPEVATLAYSIYCFGLTLGAICFSPLSETIGRRPVFLISMPLFGLFILGTGFSPNIAALLVLRFLAGCFASVGFSTGAGCVSDIWPAAQRTVPLTIYCCTAFLGPALGPYLGAVVTVSRDWRWTSWLVLFMLIVMVLIPLLFYKESYKRAILQRRARALRVAGPASAMPDSRDRSAAVMWWLRKSLMRPLHMYLTEIIVFSQNTYNAFNFALLYAFFAAFPYVFSTHYDFDSVSTGLMFLSIGVGIFVSMAIVVLFTRLVYLPQVARAETENWPHPTNCASRIAPESRLMLGMVGAPLLTGCLFLTGWSAAYEVHWIVPALGISGFGCGITLVFMGNLLYISDTYGPLYTASASASNVMIRYIAGGCFPLFAVQMFEGLGTQWACTLLGCVSLLGLFVPYTLSVYGPRIRARSRYQKG